LSQRKRVATDAVEHVTTGIVETTATATTEEAMVQNETVNVPRLKVNNHNRSAQTLEIVAGLETNIQKLPIT
jgi:hypothetical protein